MHVVRLTASCRAPQKRISRTLGTRFGRFECLCTTPEQPFDLALVQRQLLGTTGATRSIEERMRWAR